MKLHFKLVLLAAFMYLSSANLNAQQVREGYKNNNHFDIALAGGKNGISTAFSWVHLYGLGQKKKLNIGYGIRLTNYFGNENLYTTAPPQLIKDEKIDTIRFSTAQTNSLNTSINLEYNFHPKIGIGFNIDAIGVSFGKEQKGVLQSDKIGADTEIKAQPTTLNLLLIGTNDIGSLNSEFFVYYRISNKATVRAGVSHLFSEYTTTQKWADNDRFRTINTFAFLAFTFSPYKE
jgi:hypothetical protein